MLSSGWLASYGAQSEVPVSIIPDFLKTNISHHYSFLPRQQSSTVWVGATGFPLSRRYPHTAKRMLSLLNNTTKLQRLRPVYGEAFALSTALSCLRLGKMTSSMTPNFVEPHAADTAR